MDPTQARQNKCTKATDSENGNLPSMVNEKNSCKMLDINTCANKSNKNCCKAMCVLC